MKAYKKITIIGVGLMGGSLALALKKKFSSCQIVGYCRSLSSYNKIKKLGIVDIVEKDLSEAVLCADLVVLAAPIYATAKYLKEIYPYLKKGAIVIDLGSTKFFIEKKAKKIFSNEVSFVGCHPICGKEKSGAQFSDKDLYKNSLCFITADKNKPAAKIVKGIWEKLGCRVIFVSANLHDRILAKVSHLPHAIAFSFASTVQSSYMKFAGPSFKDLTRISHSPANIWADIFLSNKNNITKAITQFIQVLEVLEKLIKKGDYNQLTKWIERISIKQRSY